MSMIETLTEGIRQRSLAHEGEALLGKWERTGLLEGLDDAGRSTMARLLENQAAQLLKETSTMAAGDVEGFASVAFPIVRRVFGGLLAQDLVSVQPMSLPSGLIFFLDFTFSRDSGMVSGSGLTDLSTDSGMRLGAGPGESLYGGGVVGKGLENGVNLGAGGSQKSFYSLNDGFASPTSSIKVAATSPAGTNYGVYGDASTLPGGRFYNLLQGDPSLVSGTSTYAVVEVARNVLTGLATGSLIDLVISGSDGRGTLHAAGGFHARRLTRLSQSGLAGATESTTAIQAVGLSPAATATGAQLETALLLNVGGTLSFPIEDTFTNGGALGSVVGAEPWGLEANAEIPSIDIKVDSAAVTAVTKKLKAAWSPELAQDLNAYHNLDAEVELTSILSEQIALEIDQEILADLVNGAKGAKLYWSRKPGKFVNRETGADVVSSLFPDFTGTVSEWYETLLETINDVSARIHRKTLRGGANFIVCSPEVASILEFTSGFRASVENDGDKGSWGAMNVGSLSRKMDVHVDPYFIRNVVLVGRRGNSFLESGYVYAPYVPLQVTPTIFGTEDFVPRKGVMTRYAKHMVRPDMYGLVIVADLVG
jgi:hypothetical protein